MIRKFLYFHYGKGSGNPERFPVRFFPVNRKFPERCFGITELTEYRFGIFREKVPENVKDIM